MKKSYETNDFQDSLDGQIWEQLHRLSGFHGYEPLRQELFRTLRAIAKSKDHAERIINRVVDAVRPTASGYIGCPPPAVIADAAKQEPILISTKPIGDKCMNCNGLGFISYHHIQTAGLFAGNTYTMARSCACRRDS